MERRSWLLGASGTLAGLAIPPLRAAQAENAAATLRSLAVLDFELVDDQNTPTTKAATEARLPRATAQIQKELAARGLYRVVDPAPSKALQQQLREQQEFLYRCADCAEQIGRQLGVDLVMTTWVQKVSELILNLNLEIHEVATQRIVLSKSVDMRGNEDASWTRAVTYIVRDMAEKRARDPNYGQ